jgi:hypothetical protein
MGNMRDSTHVSSPHISNEFGTRYAAEMFDAISEIDQALIAPQTISSRSHTTISMHETGRIRRRDAYSSPAVIFAADTHQYALRSHQQRFRVTHRKRNCPCSLPRTNPASLHLSNTQTNAPLSHLGAVRDASEDIRFLETGVSFEHLT